jgi:DNA-binding transcriptional ArsR family regulator
MSQLETTVADLLARVARLEERADRRTRHVLDDDVDVPEQGTVVYSGAGPWTDRAVMWQMERPWDDVLAHDAAATAQILAALANPLRVRVVAALFGGRMSTAELTAQVDAGTSGQLFHHVKELLAAGLVHQPQRGVYELRPQHVLPLLAVLSAAIDLSPPSAADPL